MCLMGNEPLVQNKAKCTHWREPAEDQNEHYEGIIDPSGAGGFTTLSLQPASGFLPAVPPPSVSRESRAVGRERPTQLSPPIAAGREPGTGATGAEFLSTRPPLP